MTPPRPPRMFFAGDILTGRVQLDGYPVRYILITPTPTQSLSIAFSGRRGADAMLDTVFSAVEFLETRGWELVCLDQGTLAVMRRQAPVA